MSEIDLICGAVLTKVQFVCMLKDFRAPKKMIKKYSKYPDGTRFKLMQGGKIKII